MKNVVLNDTGREVEFRPARIFEKYLNMIEKDVRKEFGAGGFHRLSRCPACHAVRRKKVFRKFGFQYEECLKCGSLYVSPRPDDGAVKRHYLDSSSMAFWRKSLSGGTIDKRREKIYSPRLDWMVSMTEEYMPSARTIADFNTKDTRYIEELLDNSRFKEKIIVNPYFRAADMVSKRASAGFHLIDDMGRVSKFEASADVASAFEALDLTADTDKLVRSISAILKEKGLLFITTISISGFDLQVLWEKSKSIFPPDRINVFSKEGLNALFSRHGFEIIEYSTPGLLDLDIVKNTLNKEKGINIPKFVKTMLDTGDEQLFQDFQNFLQVNKLSSYVRMLLRKNAR